MVEKSTFAPSQLDIRLRTDINITFRSYFNQSAHWKVVHPCAQQALPFCKYMHDWRTWIDDQLIAICQVFIFQSRCHSVNFFAWQTVFQFVSLGWKYYRHHIFQENNDYSGIRHNIAITLQLQSQKWSFLSVQFPNWRFFLVCAPKWFALLYILTWRTTYSSFRSLERDGASPQGWLHTEI